MLKTVVAALSYSLGCFLAGVLFDNFRQSRSLPLYSMLHNATVLSDYGVALDGFGNALALAIGTGMDNFAVGAAYGTRGRKVYHVSNWLIACSNAGTTLGTMFVGAQILRIVSEQAATNIGASIFLVLGVLDLREAFAKHQGDAGGQGAAGGVGKRRVDPVGIVEAIPVAIGLCFTNIAGGLAAGAAGLSVLLSSVLALLCSLLLLSTGHLIGSRMRAAFPADRVGYVSGVLLLLLGASQLQI